jgi:hypothetical protein
MPASQSSPQPPKATFIFKGTIRSLKQTTMPNVPVDDATVVVHVDQVLEAPRSLARLAGNDITVRLSKGPKVAPKQQFVFQAAGWIFGRSVAVLSLSHDAVSATSAPAAGVATDPVQRKRNRDLEGRVAEADLVISGKVLVVRLPGSGLPAASAPEPARPESEHKPEWREAVVAVEKVHKGSGAATQVTLRFPNSKDVAWFRAPKFDVGQQGYFILHKPTAEAAAAAPPAPRAPPAPAIGDIVYTALHPLDFQDYSQQLQLQTAISSSAPAAK